MVALEFELLASCLLGRHWISSPVLSESWEHSWMWTMAPRGWCVQASLTVQGHAVDVCGIESQKTGLGGLAGQGDLAKSFSLSLSFLITGLGYLLSLPSQCACECKRKYRVIKMQLKAQCLDKGL
jgi:hypothetical protein